MSKTLNELKLEAQFAAGYRGHRLGKWQDGCRLSAADCEVCGLGVSVTPDPMPNEIDVGGRAVAMDCPGGWACPNCGELLRLTAADLSPVRPETSGRALSWEVREEGGWFVIGTCLHCRETIEVGVDIADKPIEVPF